MLRKSLVPGSNNLSSRPVGSDQNPALEQSNRFVVHASSCYLRRCTLTKEEKLNYQRSCWRVFLRIRNILPCSKAGQFPMLLIIMDNALFSLFFLALFSLFWFFFLEIGEGSQWLLWKQIRLFTGLVSLALIHKVPHIPST